MNAVGVVEAFVQNGATWTDSPGSSTPLMLEAAAGRLTEVRLELLRRDGRRLRAQSCAETDHSDESEERRGEAAACAGGVHGVSITPLHPGAKDPGTDGEAR